MPPDDTITGHRLDALERAVRKLDDEAVSSRWLDERFGRLADAIGELKVDIAEMKQAEKAKRLAVYAAVVTGVISVVSALVIVAMTIPAGAV